MLIEVIFTVVLAWTIVRAVMAWFGAGGGRNSDADRSLANNSASSESSHIQPSMSMPLPSAQSAIHFGSQSSEDEFIAQLLTRARQSLTDEKPMQALNLVLAAARQQGGEVRVFDVLNEARRDFGLQPHSNPFESQRLQLQRDRHERATLELIDDVGANDNEDEAMDDEDIHNRREAFSMNSMHHSLNEASLAATTDASMDSSLSAQSSVSLLESRGDGGVISDALLTGDYASCPHCGAVVARSRLDQHARFWCSAVHDDD